MKNIKNAIVILLLLVASTGKSQEIKTSPYHTTFWGDGAWVVGGIAANAYGLSLIINKDDITEEELNELNEDDIIGIDRWAAGYNSDSASKISDIPFYGSFFTPFLLLIPKETRGNAGQLSVLMLESVSTAGAIYTISAGLVNRARPRVYDENLALDTRIDNDNQRSFFSGHVAASAATTFFVAQVLHDYFPDSAVQPFIWGTAAAIPAAVGYFRIKSGNHFLTDVLLGYAIGAASGVLIPNLHKRKDSKLRASAGMGMRGEAMLSLNYTF